MKAMIMTSEEYRIDNQDSVAVYVHVPFCQQKCDYCSFYSEPIGDWDTKKVVDVMIKELHGYAIQGRVHTLYIGGGSPSCLPLEVLEHLVAGISEYVSPLVQSEFTIELNPSQVNRAMLKMLFKRGVNRISFGAQSFIQKELDTLGRQCSVKQTYDAITLARKVGFKNINIDLIFAIPGSTMESWEENLKIASKLDIQHVSAYSLSYETDTPLQMRLTAGHVVALDEEQDRVMYEMAIDRFKEAGLGQYEISNFARNGYQCQHNLTYWANRPYIGIGPGASSFWRGVRRTTIADAARYVEVVDKGGDATTEMEKPDALQMACETAILMLRRIRGIDLKKFKVRTGFDALELFGDVIEQHNALGLLALEDGRIRLRRSALPIADTVLCDFALV